MNDPLPTSPSTPALVPGGNDAQTSTAPAVDAISQIIGQMILANAPKSGWLTTEFWIAALFVGSLLGGMFLQIVPANLAVPYVALLAVLHGVSRYLLKRQAGNETLRLASSALVFGASAPAQLPPSPISSKPNGAQGDPATGIQTPPFETKATEVAAQ